MKLPMNRVFNFAHVLYDYDQHTDQGTACIPDHWRSAHDSAKSRVNNTSAHMQLMIDHVMKHTCITMYYNCVNRCCH